MADRPILFSAPMIRAILREIEQPGTGKTMTRRVLKPQPPERATVHAVNRTPGAAHPHWEWRFFHEHGNIPVRFAVGDRLWVRESGVQLGNDVDASRECDGYEACGYRYAADGSTVYLPGMFPGHSYERRRNSIHMPLWASRLTLTVTAVKVERLQGISEEDAGAEGVTPAEFSPWDDAAFIENLRPHTAAFARLWNSINGPGAWDANPWTVAISFTPHLCNIDRMEADHVD